MRIVLALIAIAASSSTACWFVDGVPAGSTILCATNDACPSGNVCDLGSHTCTSPGAHGATVTSAKLDPPALAHGVARLTIDADVALDAKTAPVVDVDNGALTFTLESTSGSTQTMLVDVDAVDEGRYDLSAITVKAVDGPAHKTNVDVSLIVDRTPPSLLNARLLSAPADDVFSDVDGTNTIEAGALPSEPLANAVLVVGNIESAPCDVVANSEITCVATVDASAVDGTVTPHIDAVDLAGNAASVALEDVVVDTAPPSLIAASVDVAIETDGATTTTAARTSIVTITFLASEDVVAPTVALAGAGQEGAFNVDVGGTRVAATLSAVNVAAGTYDVTAHLVDRFGHAADVTVATSIVFTGADADCPRPPGVNCVDLDADGHFGKSGCPEGDDDDDRDFTVNPGAFELPGDGVDNDGVGGDEPIDETSGAFVDSEAGDDVTGDGSRAHPFRTLDAAQVFLDGTGPTREWAFLAARATPYQKATSSDYRYDTLGGLDPSTWTRVDGQKSTIAATSLDDFPILDSVDAPTDVVTNGIELVRSHTKGINAGSGAIVVVNSVVGGDLLGDRIVVVESDVEFLGAGLDLVVHRSIVRDTAVSSGSILATSSIFTATSGPAIAETGGSGPVSVFHCTLIASPPNAPFEADASVATITFVADVFDATAPQSVITAQGAVPAFHLVGNRFVTGGPAPMLLDGVAVFESEIDGCTFGGCVTTSDNALIGDPGFATVAHLAANSPLKDAAPTATDFGAPTAVLVDVDGQCRYEDGAPDIGADEL